MVLARRDSEVADALNPKLVPDSAQVAALIELNLIGDAAGTEALVARVLQVPASLVLLHKLTNNTPLSLSSGAVVDSPPDLQVLDSISILVLRRTLPGDDVSAQGRKAEFEDVLCGQRGSDVSGRGVDNEDPGSPLARRRWLCGARDLLFR